MKKYKTYFDKKDTPYMQKFQKRKKYHIVWKRRPYKWFLHCAVVKIKLFGLFTIYNPSEEELVEIRKEIKEIKEKKDE